MINRKILEQMGFIKGRGFGHEVLYHHTECWVHYGTKQEFVRYAAYGSHHVCFNGDTDTMEHFFAEFIENVEAGVRASLETVSEEW